MDNLLTVTDLYKNYTNKTETLQILQGVNVTIDHGETISIAGESGSGKSTFLNMIGGLDNVSRGSIRIQGTEITSLDEEELSLFRNHKVGFIFQSHYLLDEFTALENVMIPFLMNNFNKRKAGKKAKSLLDFMGLSHRFNHYPGQLSGGEKQRVAIARAFMNEPILILADEPTGNLDEKNADKVLELLFNITSKENHALVIVSHSTHVADMASRHYHLEGGILTEM